LIDYLATKSFAFLDIGYPKIYNRGYYGNLLTPSRISIRDSFHIYTFPADPNVYEYNLLANDYEVYGGKSIYLKDAPPLIG
jgi:hypothetical protein